MYSTKEKEPFGSDHFVFECKATTSSPSFYPFTTVLRLEVCSTHNAQARYCPDVKSCRSFNILSLCLNFSSSSLRGRSFFPSRPLQLSTWTLSSAPVGANPPTVLPFSLFLSCLYLFLCNLLRSLA